MGLRGLPASQPRLQMARQSQSLWLAGRGAPVAPEELPGKAGWAHPVRGLPTVPLGAFLESRKLRRTQAGPPRGLAAPPPSCCGTPGPVLGSAGEARPCCPEAGWCSRGRPAGASWGADPPSPLHVRPLLCTPAAALPPGPGQRPPGRSPCVVLAVALSTLGLAPWIRVVY